MIIKNNFYTNNNNNSLNNNILKQQQQQQRRIQLSAFLQKQCKSNGGPKTYKKKWCWFQYDTGLLYYHHSGAIPGGSGVGNGNGETINVGYQIKSIQIENCTIEQSTTTRLEFVLHNNNNGSGGGVIKKQQWIWRATDEQTVVQWVAGLNNWKQRNHAQNNLQRRPPNPIGFLNQSGYHGNGSSADLVNGISPPLSPRSQQSLSSENLLGNSSGSASSTVTSNLKQSIAEQFLKSLSINCEAGSDRSSGKQSFGAVKIRQLLVRQNPPLDYDQTNHILTLIYNQMSYLQECYDEIQYFSDNNFNSNNNNNSNSNSNSNPLSSSTILKNSISISSSGKSKLNLSVNNNNNNNNSIDEDEYDDQNNNIRDEGMFALLPDHLSMYIMSYLDPKSLLDTFPCGMIPLHISFRVKKVSPSTRKHCFKIIHDGLQSCKQHQGVGVTVERKEPYYLSAENEEECNAWMTIVQSSIQKSDKIIQSTTDINHNNNNTPIKQQGGQQHRSYTGSSNGKKGHAKKVSNSTPINLSSLAGSSDSSMSPSTSPLKQSIETKPIFGLPIAGLMAEQSKSMQLPIPYVLYKCFQHIKLNGLHEEGLFRVSGSVIEIELLKNKFEQDPPLPDIDLTQHDIHAVTGLVKSFFRKLPTPLIPSDLDEYATAVSMAQSQTQEQKIQEYKFIFESLDPVIYTIFQTLLNLLRLTVENKATTKMTEENILIVVMPTLKCSPVLVNNGMRFYSQIFDINNDILSD
ncbi:pleckstrin domain-containing protein [Heterostelium album PN500]|uniref:Pleckstrin domain-containing protein n=1 Tax=Heterostelium pallidum (strain ATCC 26659 / Pp 5 / PN500) TaxID=670386 RepID=D3B3M7_HETP5|nr:pleckstrin domain-containing protein [Heterostelium album PN500]EFA83925.1 pleckstrin domain-containing protein [Heterostelium album PN500]|eukprot:XP_020436042.1 pleckstrin domain-containing protein [Heterostelium album PN500]